MKGEDRAVEVLTNASLAVVFVVVAIPLLAIAVRLGQAVMGAGCP